MRWTHRLPLTLGTAALVLAGTTPLTAQESSAGPAPDAPPQTFDWHAGDIAETTPWGQPVDVEATRSILSWTTAPEYTTPLVHHIPEHPSIASPGDHFGAPIGEPGTLHRTGEIHGYLRALADASDRVRFRELGETEEGNRLGLVQVASEATLDRLPAIREAYRRLADPRVTDPAEAAELIDGLPLVYLVTAGLHSPETGPPEMVMELAYRLAVSESPELAMIRDSVLLMVVPVTEPDGRNRVVDWYRRHYPTPDTTHEVPGVPYWGSYIFHDNNRDGLQLTARLTQEVIGLINDWRVPFAHDLHESIPYLYTSTGTGPYNPQVDPITIAEWTWFANYEVTALTALGLPGVWTHGFYDGWNPTYMIWAANTRNGLGRFYETFGNSIPWTRQRVLGERSTSVEWYRPNPPRDTAMWSLRNNTNYMQTGVLTALSLAAQNRTRLLRQFRTKSENALRRGRTEAPYAWVVPREQRRNADAQAMLRLLGRQGVELHAAADSARLAVDGADADSVLVEPGDFVVRMDQPYRSLVLTLMTRQEYPSDAPRPYDDVAWTFPLMYGTTAYAVADSAVLALPMTAVHEPSLPGRVAGSGDWWLVEPEASAFTLPARLDLGRTPVWAVEDTVVLGAGSEVPDTVTPGAWLIRRRDLPDARAREWAAAFGLDLLGVPDDDVAAAPRHELDLPRLAVLHSWRSTQAEGWTRFTLDHFGMPFTYIAETELADMGPLRRRFDVILFPDQAGSGRAIFHGLDPADGPVAYERSRDAPSLGYPDETADMTGGMGLEGLIALRDFVADGGTFIGLRAGSTLPVEMGLVRDIGVRDRPEGLFVPGSLVRGDVVRPDHPLAYGYEPEPALHHRFGPYLAVDDELEEEAVVVRYAEEDLGLSGLVEGGGKLAGEPAVLSVADGAGAWVLFGFNPLNRHQNHMNFAFVWNALLHWNDLAP